MHLIHCDEQFRAWGLTTQEWQNLLIIHNSVCLANWRNFNQQVCELIENICLVFKVFDKKRCLQMVVWWWVGWASDVDGTPTSNASIGIYRRICRPIFFFFIITFLHNCWFSSHSLPCLSSLGSYLLTSFATSSLSRPSFSSLATWSSSFESFVAHLAAGQMYLHGLV